jgi:hypothetical protein
VPACSAIDGVYGAKSRAVLRGAYKHALKVYVHVLALLVVLSKQPPARTLTGEVCMLY